MSGWEKSRRSPKSAFGASVNLPNCSNDVEATAAEWVIRLGGGALRDDERRDFERWLAEAPAHTAAFAHARAVWANLGALQAESCSRSRDIAPLSSPIPRRSRLTIGGAAFRSAALAALLVTGIGIASFWLGDPILILQADYRTGPGESRSVVLADGSAVQLNTASALAVHFDGHERRVALLAGEAFFDVAAMRGGENRPFVVEAGNGRARALGTQFSVDREGAATRIVVAEHQVQVSAAPPEAAEPNTVVLSPGQAVRYDPASGLGAVTSVDADRATSWRRGRLIFDRVRLEDVVAELNRYRRGRIVIATAALGDRRVSGVFSTTELDAGLESIARELGARAVSVPPFLTMLY